MFTGAWSDADVEPGRSWSGVISKRDKKGVVLGNGRRGRRRSTRVGEAGARDCASASGVGGLDLRWAQRCSETTLRPSPQAYCSRAADSLRLRTQAGTSKHRAQDMHDTASLQVCKSAGLQCLHVCKGHGPVARVQHHALAL